MKHVDLSVDRTRQGPRPLYQRIAGHIVFAIAWVIATILYPFKVVFFDFFYMGTVRLFSPAYKKHMYWLNQQNLHLDGLHSTGPGPDCEYCAGIVESGAYYRPWVESGWKPE